MKGFKKLKTNALNKLISPFGQVSTFTLKERGTLKVILNQHPEANLNKAVKFHDIDFKEQSPEVKFHEASPPALSELENVSDLIAQ